MSSAPVNTSESLESLVGRVADEFLRRQEAGDRPDVEEYAARHPEATDVLRKVLAALRVLDASRDGGADAGEPAADGLVGGTLGDYRLLREVGRGGMGVVYEAVQVSLNRRVALKVLPFAATLDPRRLQRFKNEAQAAAGLHHTHIVPVYGVGCERGVHYYAMQFIEGHTLAAALAALRRQRGLAGGSADEASAAGAAAGQPTTAYPPAADEPAAAPASTEAAAALTTEKPGAGPAYCRRVAELGVQAAEALEHAHQLGVVHRDVKPANLLVDGRGSLWVTDFGLAQVAMGEGLTLTGDLVGTLRYMSPEQALAKRAGIDQRTDVYSLGATLYELLTLRPAFAGADRQELLRQIAFEEPWPPRKIDRGIPAELETIILKAMAKNPDERYGSAKELAEDLGRYVRDEPIRARRPSVVQRARRWSRRHPALVRSAAVFVVLAAAVLGYGVRDRQARLAVAADALREAEQRYHEGRLADALAAARRGEALLAGVPAAAALRQRAADLRLDMEVVGKLEEARLRAAEVQEQDLDWVGSSQEFANVFRLYGVGWDNLAEPEMAVRLRTKPTRVELAAALFAWAWVYRESGAGDDRPWKAMLALACAIDPDEWRNRLRDAYERNDLPALRGLAVSADVGNLPPSTLHMLGTELGQMGAWAEAVQLLEVAQRRHPGDYWINFELATFCAKLYPPRLDEAIRYSTVAVSLRPGALSAHNNLGLAFGNRAQFDAAIAEYKEALRLDPDDAKAHLNLGNALKDKGRLDLAIAEYREALRLKPDYGKARNNLGAALYEKGDVDAAIAALTEAHRLWPHAAEPQYNLGRVLRDKGDRTGAIAEFREALRVKPDYADAHVALGNVFYSQGMLDRAIVEFKEALRLKPDYAEAYNNLGHALFNKGDLDGAIAEIKQALRLKPDSAYAHNNLGSALEAKGDRAGAIAEFKEAGRLKQGFSQPHYNLGTVLENTGDLDGAIAEFNEALRIEPDYPEAHCNLGHALRGKGQFSEALASLRRGHELGSKKPGWSYPSDQWLRDCERLVRLDRQLPAILAGAAQPADPDRALQIAELCIVYKRLPAAAARLYHQGLSAQPPPDADLVAHHRYNGACAAALAGCGQGKDARTLNDKERARWRAQALEWLRAELAARAKLLDSQSPPAAALTQELRHWQADTDLAGVRDPQALAKLPDGERKNWQALWADVDQLLQKAQTKPPAEKPRPPAKP
jgi:tetratricopeptide (TPR) repeat protein